jgi:hypothetical protein
MLLEPEENFVQCQPSLGVEDSTPCEMAVKFCFFAYFTSLRNMAASKTAVKMDITYTSDLLLLRGHHWY